MEQQNKYQNGKIYQIVPLDYSKCYVGSTIAPLNKRMGEHRKEYTRHLNGDCVHINSCKLFDEFGLKNCKIELLETFPCNSKEELLAREGYWIRQKSDSVNRCIAGRTNKEWREENKEELAVKSKIWREEHKEELAEKKKTYIEANKELVKERKQKYYELNKEAINAKTRQHRIDNPEHYKEYETSRYIIRGEQQNTYRKEKIQCECGCILARGNMADHRKSKKHQKFILAKEIIPNDSN